MRIESVRVEDFRNISLAEFSPSPCANIIYGGNAQGKTNILEALWLFSGARSFRGTRDSGLVMFGARAARLSVSFYAGSRLQTASISISGEKKNVELNGIKLSSRTGLSGALCVVLFSPDHLPLVKQGPENRRAMIDQALCQAYPKYAGILDSYKKILRQRASLLRDIPKNSSLYDLLDVWDKSLVEYGSYISAVRDSYIRKLAENAAELYGGISNGKEILGVYYKPAFGVSEKSLSRADYTDLMKQAVKDNRADDLASGHTSTGPHLDDMEIQIDGVPARGFASQGQQRSCVLALKLAECRILEERSSEPPVVLLDDVMSELDSSRRSYLLNRLEGVQSVITCCDKSLFSGLKGGNVYHMENGTVNKE